MDHYITEAETQSQQMLEQIQREAEEIQAKLNRGELVTVKEIKNWRKEWIDNIVPLRKLAKKAKTEGEEDQADEVKDIAIDLEDAVKDLEDKLKDDARELEEAQERGGVLTHEERIQLARKEGKKSHGIACPNCGAALPESTTEICGYCESVLTDNTSKRSKGWVLLQEEAVNANATPDKIYEAAKERIEALRQTYIAQLEVEKAGLMAVLEAGKKRTKEFDNAYDDSNTRLDRIWDRIREVGQKEEERLYRLEAYKKEEKLGDFYQEVCDQLGELNNNVMGGIERKANFKWDRQADGSDTIVKCSHCGAELGIVNPETAGEVTCTHCNGVTKYSAHISKLDVTINKMIDEKMEEQMPLEDQCLHWKNMYIKDPSEEYRRKYEEATRALYDKQLFYIKDDAKRNENVERYVQMAMKEIK